MDGKTPNASAPHHGTHPAAGSANEMAIHFWGMCSFIERRAAGVCEVYLPTGSLDPGCHTMVMNHLPMLAIPAEDIDIVPSLPPTTVVFHGMTQLACWSLTGLRVSVGPGLSGLPNWTKDNKDQSVNFANYHMDQDARTRADLLEDGYPVIDLVGGQIACGMSRPTKVYQRGRVVKNEVTHHITWSAKQRKLTLSLRDGNGEVGDIFVKAPTGIAISNVAPVAPMHGLMHFGHYYTMFQKDIACDDRLSLSMSGEDVYDCIPPTPGS
jgi:hypothetical protein